MRQIPRLFVEQPLAEGAQISLEGPQAHYLLNVLRVAEGTQLLLCDDSTGEYRALVAAKAKRHLDLQVIARERPREPVRDLWLCAAPIKGPRWDWIAEKACELGAFRLQPVLTERTVVRQVNTDRLRAHMVEAAEQCGRTALPEAAEAVPLATLLRDWPADRHLIFADEAGGDASSAMRDCPAPAAILIGPEGGFSPAERQAIRALPRARAITLGPRILRADTAAVATLALWGAFHSD